MALFASTTVELENSSSLTGGAYDFQRATTSLTQKLLSSPKKVTLVRHGLSSWNKEGRVQVCFSDSLLCSYVPWTYEYRS